MPFILILTDLFYYSNEKKYSSFVLFILPIVAYLFFASGVNGFTLPVITPSVPDLSKWESLNGETVTLNGKITILGFSGSDILKKRNFFNLNEKVYQRYHTFKVYNLGLSSWQKMMIKKDLRCS
jgi:hypothetical protein